MMRWVIQDYFRAFRWQNIKEQYKYGAGYLSVNILILLPTSYLNFSKEIGRSLASFLLNLPVAYALFTTMLHPMALPKLMYLCPMSKDMRRDYITKASVVRMAAPILVGLPGILWLVISDSLDWLCGIGILLNISLLSLVLGRGNNALGYAKKKSTKDMAMGLDDIFGVRQFVLVAITLLINMIYVASIGDGDSWLFGTIMLGVILLISLPITISCMKEWPKAIEEAVSFESSGGAWRESESK